MVEIICLQCGETVLKPKSKYKFCCSSCAVKYNNTGKHYSDDRRQKISVKLKAYYENVNSEEQSIKIGKLTKGKYRGNNAKSILEFSSTTVTKVLNRLKMKCCICGWDEDTIDLHHINGRKIPNADDHSNLSPVCPNHHRLIHSGKIKTEQIISLDKILPINWLDYYYG